ncbi:MAG: dTDP-4-dehydrorhamnose reductase [Anaerolineae bacterium]|nr:dTDP-4-dehydrorhamnose reductase [Anaerolineae bacterium]
MRIFITGHKGQLGKALRASLVTEGHTLLGGDLPEWEMTNADQVMESLRVFSPDIVIHAAALTDVDYCAGHPDEAVQVNGVGTYNVALACREVNALLVSISTNEVFDGRARQPYQEYDQRNPSNPYGYSKYVAEQVVERIAPRYMIVRTAWLYASGGVNFIHKIIARARSGSRLRVVTDEISSPTCVTDLAVALMDLIEIDRPGIYHLVNAGECSRYHFACEILRLIGSDASVEPIHLEDFERPSMPPSYAPLANVFGAAAGIELRPWQEALAEYVTQYEAQ